MFTKKYDKQIIINSIFSVLQVFINSILIFFIYSFMIKSLGKEMFGAWSLVFSITLFGNIGGLGLSNALIKYCAEFFIDRNYQSMIKYCNQSLIIQAILMGLLFPLLYLGGIIYLKNALETTLYLQIKELFLLLLIGLAIRLQSNIMFSIIQALNKSVYYSISIVISSLIYATLIFMLINTHHLLAIGYSYLIQSIILLVLGFIFIKKEINSFSFYFFWNKKVLKKLLNYGGQFQLISILQFFYDPVTKILLNYFGGLVIISYFELSSKVIITLRSLIVNVVLQLVPGISGISHKQGLDKNIVIKVFNLTYLCSVPLMTMICIFSDVISIIWINEKSETFQNFIILLSFAWMINLFSLSFYMINLAIGELKINIFSHLITGIFNPILGFIFGLYFGATWIIFGWSIALILGAIYTITFSLSKQNISLDFLNRNHLYLIVISFFFVFVKFSFPSFSQKEIFESSIIISGVYFIFILLDKMVQVEIKKIWRLIWFN